MAGFSRFLKRWATTGSILEPTDAQADAGFAFLGATPPSVELFNAILQQYDDKDNTLFAWIAAVLAAAGITPADTSPGQLLAALNELIAAGIAPLGVHGLTVFPATGSFTALTVWHEIDVTGAGGGAGGVNGSAQSSGGSGGGYAWGRYELVPGQVYPVTIGNGGPGGNGTPTNGTAGQTSSFGSILSATGGGFGYASGSGGQAAISPGGVGIGGQLNLQGTSGSGSLPNGGGSGGAAFRSAGAPGGSAAGTGSAALLPGAGGAGTASSIGGQAGGAGASGLCTVRW